jgi:hypothetical protein
MAQAVHYLRSERKRRANFVKPVINPTICNLFYNDFVYIWTEQPQTGLNATLVRGVVGKHSMRTHIDHV